MSDKFAAFTGAAQSLRDTAKWYAGSVGATAAGVFAGSSLTELGALTWSEDQTRLLLVALGALAGFGALAWIFGAAASVLSRDIFTLEQIATGTGMTLIFQRSATA